MSCSTAEVRFLEPSVSRTSRYLEPNLDSLGFASLKLYNFTPDFSNPRFLETPDNSNQFWLPWDKLTLDNSSLRKFPNQQIKVQFFGPATPYCELREISKIVRKNWKHQNISKSRFSKAFCSLISNAPSHPSINKKGLEFAYPCSSNERGSQQRFQHLLSSLL